MAKLLLGKPVADAISARLAPRIERLEACEVTPLLGIVRVGKREDDLAYERGIEKRFGSLGISVRKAVLPDDCAQSELICAIEDMNDDANVHGVLLFRPLPKHLDEAAACEALLPQKDVDGITQGSLFGTFSGRDVGFPPCTAEACVKVLEHYETTLEGSKVAVIGRSLVIGRPLSMMLLAKDATVTMCHTKTRELARECRDADILVAAAGRAGVVGRNAVHERQTIVDVGINWDADAGKLVGDVAFDEIEPVVSAITPVPGGVGAVTTAVLAEHVVEAAVRHFE